MYFSEKTILILISSVVAYTIFLIAKYLVHSKRQQERLEAELRAVIRAKESE